MIRVNVQHPAVKLVRLAPQAVRVFGGGANTSTVPRPLAVPPVGGLLILGYVDAQAYTATTAIIGIHITVVRTQSTIFGPKVKHAAVRRDSTVVFGPGTGV